MATEARLRANKKYIANHYTGFTVKIPNDIAAEFKVACEKNGVSARSVLKQAIEDYIKNNK